MTGGSDHRDACRRRTSAGSPWSIKDSNVTPLLLVALHVEPEPSRGRPPPSSCCRCRSAARRTTSATTRSTRRPAASQGSGATSTARHDEHQRRPLRRRLPVRAPTARRPSNTEYRGSYMYTVDVPSGAGPVNIEIYDAGLYDRGSNEQVETGDRRLQHRRHHDDVDRRGSRHHPPGLRRRRRATPSCRAWSSRRSGNADHLQEQVGHALLGPPRLSPGRYWLTVQTTRTRRRRQPLRPAGHVDRHAAADACRPTAT